MGNNDAGVRLSFREADAFATRPVLPAGQPILSGWEIDRRRLGLPAEGDALQQGFQLAYFLISDRPRALRVLADALNKFSTQRRRERRRAYWRNKNLKRGITRINHQEADALQWLILFESDRAEKEEESRGAPTLDDMAVRYIKSLVRITTAMSSFYVNVGLHRLLHNYTTPEIQRIYETVTDRYLGADEYRRAKSVLMTKLERRFGQLLRTCRTQYGELRFEAWDKQEPWQALVEECLCVLTPWSTAKNCPVPADFGPENSTIPDQLAPARGARITQDQLETNRCHAFIDPECYGRLTRALAFDPPEQRLALPRFFMDKKQSESKSDPPSPLTSEERKSLKEHLSRESQRRRDSSAKRIRVVVDGTEQTILDARRQRECRLEIEEGAEMVEFLDEDAAEELVLATYRVRYTEAQGFAPSDEALAVGRNRLIVNITPAALPLGGQPHRAQLYVRYQETEPLKAHLDLHAWWAFGRYAAAAVAMVMIGWIGGSNFSSHRFESRFVQGTGNLAALAAPVPSAVQPSPASDPGKLAVPYVPYTLVPDEEIQRGAGGPDSTSVVLPSDRALLRLDLPLPFGTRNGLYLIKLKVFGTQAVVLSQTVRRRKGLADSRPLLSLWVPAPVLQSRQDYSVELSALRPKGGWEVLNSYSFKTTEETK